MARAAQGLFMTGPAITQQIQQLEKTLGVPAFDRIGRRLRLTAAGDRALAAANDVHTRLAALAKEMDALRKRDDGTLHLGILATGTHILPPLLAEFRRRSPGIAVHMAVSSCSYRFLASTSTQTTWLPISARQAPVTRPT